MKRLIVSISFIILLCANTPLIGLAKAITPFQIRMFFQKSIMTTMKSYQKLKQVDSKNSLKHSLRRWFRKFNKLCADYETYFAKVSWTKIHSTYPMEITMYNKYAAMARRVYLQKIRKYPLKKYKSFHRYIFAPFKFYVNTFRQKRAFHSQINKLAQKTRSARTSRKFPGIKSLSRRQILAQVKLFNHYVKLILKLKKIYPVYITYNLEKSPKYKVFAYALDDLLTNLTRHCLRFYRDIPFRIKLFASLGKYVKQDYSSEFHAKHFSEKIYDKACFKLLGALKTNSLSTIPQLKRHFKEQNRIFQSWISRFQRVSTVTQYEKQFKFLIRQIKTKHYFAFYLDQYWGAWMMKRKKTNTIKKPLINSLQRLQRQLFILRKKYSVRIRALRKKINIDRIDIAPKRVTFWTVAYLSRVGTILTRETGQKKSTVYFRFPLPKSVIDTYKLPKTQFAVDKVYIVGQFSQWKTDKRYLMKKIGKNKWQITLFAFPRQKILYKFFIKPKNKKLASNQRHGGIWTWDPEKSNKSFPLENEISEFIIP